MAGRVLRLILRSEFRAERAGAESRACASQRDPANTPVTHLATTLGNSLRRDEIIDFIWPGANFDCGVKHLGKALHAARHAMPIARRASSSMIRPDIYFCPGRSSLYSGPGDRPACGCGCVVERHRSPARVLAGQRVDHDQPRPQGELRVN